MTKRLGLFLSFFIFLVSFYFFFFKFIFAEVKSNAPSGQNIPKLEAGPDDPSLSSGHVYPNWGPICQRYTYSVIYSDKKNRSPEYVKIYFNGVMIDMEKENSQDDNYLSGVKYIFKNVPNRLSSNFYFFEASNGVGKTRSNIIDSPDNGPVLFRSAFDKNEIAVVDVGSKTKILSYDVGEEWVGGVALSDDGGSLAVKTNKKIYYFDTSRPEKPVWVYEGPTERPNDVKGGVDISANGTRIIASIGGKAILFDSKSNQPLWIYKGSGNQAYNVAISSDGRYMAMGTAGGVISTTEGYQSSKETNLLILWNEGSEVPLWQYHTEGNFHDVSLSSDGSFITGATGCPDRRFYLFSRDSNEPIIRSEMLTRDSPVHRAKISGDGRFAAVGSESGDGAVFVFSKESSQPLWKFSTPQRSSVRALNFTADGRYVGAATFKGDVYIFDRDSDLPVSHWNVGNVSLGGVDIAEDGSFIVTGGTDNKLHIFKRGLVEDFSIDFSEYVEEIDISANGKYVAAGTGGSVYFFEAFSDDIRSVECGEIIEPPAETSSIDSGPVNNYNKSPIQTKKESAVDMIYIFCGFGSFGLLAGYVTAVKLGLFSKLKILVSKKSAEGFRGRKLNKLVVALISIAGLTFFVLSFLPMTTSKEDDLPQVGGNNDNRESTEAGCGNSICEPDFGETEGGCPDDCFDGQ